MQVINDSNVVKSIDTLESSAWKSFVWVVQKSLGKHEASDGSM